MINRNRAFFYWEAHNYNRRMRTGAAYNRSTALIWARWCIEQARNRDTLRVMAARDDERHEWRKHYAA